MPLEPQPETAPLIDALQRMLAQLAEPTAVLRAILDQAVRGAGADRGLLVEVERHGELTYRVLHGLEPEHVDGEAGRFSRGLFQRVLDTGDAIVLEDALDDVTCSGLESVRALHGRGIACLPIRGPAGIVAILHLESRVRGHFGPARLELLRSLTEIGGPILTTLRAGRDVMQERDQLRLAEHRWRGEAEEARKLLASDWSFGRFVGHSAPVRTLEATVRKAAATEFPILVSGETGTGKSIVARVLHYSGPRAAQPLVTVFCPSLERGMVEAELFGHRRGAFTGAVRDRLGKVQAADGGTLFLDEIGELPLEIQPKLLRLLQEKTYERVGDPHEAHADVRVIAATNRDLEVEVREGRFRRDLFERLRFIPVRIPPLRERPEDIPVLLRHCLEASGQGRWIEIGPEAEAFLVELDFSWPGNVRHVEQLAARLIMEAPHGPVSAATLFRLLEAAAEPPRPAASVDGEAAAPPTPGIELGLPRVLEQAERRWLEEALRRHPELTRAELAARLEISPSALYKKLRQHGLGS